MHHNSLRKKCGIVLKIHFEKAYDKVNLDLLMSYHEKNGFSDVWCPGIRQTLENGTLCQIKWRDGSLFSKL
jgi:hypothetical protein